MGRIEAKSLTYSYADGFTALNGIDLTIDDGEFVCVVGHSGCGKSTLLRVISGLSLPTSGELYFNGAPIEGPGLDRAVVFQQYSLFPWKTARRNVEFGMRQAHPDMSRSEIAQRAESILADVGMLDAADRYPFQLSGGMKQRVAIARALALDSDTLLLDEPFGALDAQRRAQLQTLLIKLWSREGKRKTVVFVTHDIDEAILLADRIVFMRPGEVTASIPVDIERPRNADALVKDPRYDDIKHQLADLFSLDEDKEAEDEA